MWKSYPLWQVPSPRATMYMLLQQYRVPPVCQLDPTAAANVSIWLTFRTLQSWSLRMGANYPVMLGSWHSHQVSPSPCAFAGLANAGEVQRGPSGAFLIARHVRKGVGTRNRLPLFGSHPGCSLQRHRQGQIPQAKNLELMHGKPTCQARADS